MAKATDELTNLAIKYGTDKWGKHNYTPVYYELFKDRKEKVKKVLEIGVAEGAGLRMFRDFFPNAMIYGAEIDPKRIFDGDRLQIFHCDQARQRDIARLLYQTGYEFDLIVDDGSHKKDDQLLTCEWIMSLVNHGVTYIIEDVADTSIVELLSLKYDCEVKKLSKRYDDCLVIVRHKGGKIENGKS